MKKPAEGNHMKTFKKSVTIAALLICTAGLQAADVNLGLNTWYSWWWPDIAGSFRGEDNGITAIDPSRNSRAYNDTFSVDPCLMAGPLLSVRFSEKWILGFVLLVSLDCKTKGRYDVFHDDDFAGWDFTYTQANEMTFRRYDGDVTLAYRLNGSFSIFGGFKYLRWDGSGSGDLTTDGSVNYTYDSHTESEVTGRSIGPAIGLNYALPLTGMFFLTASGSLLALYTFSEQDLTTEWTQYINGSGTTTGGSSTNESDKSYYLGFNATTGIGCYFDSLNTTLILGGRCQYLRKEGQDPEIFCGITFSAIYSL